MQSAHSHQDALPFLRARCVPEMYFVLHPHGLNMCGRWTGLGYDGRIMIGFATMGRTQEESEDAMRRLISSEGVPYVDE